MRKHLAADPRLTPPTRAALLARLDEDPRRDGGAPRVLSAAELGVLGAVLARLLPPFPDFPARPAAEEVAAALDQRLARGEIGGNGWRYDALPPDADAYRRGLRSLGEGFPQQPPSEQDARLRALAAGELDAACGFPAARWWEELRADAVERYAAHPAVQATVGYDGFADGPLPPPPRPDPPARPPMRRYPENEPVDAVVIGTGAGGGPLLMRLARAGLKVVALEAGRFWDPAHDFATDEVAQAKLFWTDERLSAGADPVPFGNNNSGVGVGGSTLHYTAYTPRPQPDDFRLASEFGVGRDWPLSHADLEPYFDELETLLGVSGPSPYPWGPPRRRGYALPPLPLNAPARLMARAGEKLGLRTAPAPNAALSAPYFQPGVGWRPACTNRGFCQAGCSVGAKASVDVIFVPPALAAGAELRTECFATRLERDGNGAVSGVVYRDADGRERCQRSRHVFLCAGAVETPRLLLMNDGLANGSGQVGRNFMAHTGLQLWARFDEPTFPWRGIPGGLISEDTHRPADADFAGGYLLQSIGVMPVTYATQLARARADLRGGDLGRALRDYPHVAGINILGECLPSPDNFLELADEPDARGLPKPRVHFTAGPNEHRLTAHADRTMRALWDAAGAREPWAFGRFAHTLGTCRMGADPADSVVDADGRVWDVPGLFVCDNSTFPSALAVNPALTQMALSLRTADRFLGVR